MANVFPPDTGKDTVCPCCKAEIEIDLTHEEKAYDSVFIECWKCHADFELEIIVSYTFRLLENNQ